jgi:ribose 5-phosphate isomerase B
MRIILCADHAGFLWKEKLVLWLASLGHDVIDVGAKTYIKDDDYPRIAKRGVEALRAEKKAVGIFVCGSGVGMTIAANRFSGVRAAHAESKEVARRAKQEDYANVLVLGSRVTSFAKAKSIILTWLKANTSASRRHRRRVRMLGAL